LIEQVLGPDYTVLCWIYQVTDIEHLILVISGEISVSVAVLKDNVVKGDNSAQ